MSQETADRIFEPLFFTTKETATEPGLGFVHRLIGFAKQSEVI